MDINPTKSIGSALLFVAFVGVAIAVIWNIGFLRKVVTTPILPASISA